ncbi:MAG: TlpA family protein disulfide reductase [Bdellovibrionales bacterium]|nr:TlpA family protein disulfide reductase [Bdellovibrionales bacterium]
MSIKKIIILSVLLVVLASGFLLTNSFLNKQDKIKQKVKILSVTSLKKTLDKSKGSVVLVSYWATWCDSCKVNLKELGNLQKKYKSQGFRVIGVSVDDVEDLFKFSLVKFLYSNAGSYFLKAIMKKDKTKEIMTVLEKKWIEIVPIYYLIGRDKKIIKKFVGSRSLKEIKSVLKKLF